MRRDRRDGEKWLLILYRGIIQIYTPYVLVRCARYTNARRQAQQIGAYTLTTACVLARELPAAVPPGVMVETMLHVIGPDVLAGGHGEDWRQGLEEPLFADRETQQVAQAVNSLGRAAREPLLLHHVSRLAVKNVASLLRQPVGMVQARIARGERLLAQRLAGRPDAGRVTVCPDVPALLARFAAGLDDEWMQEVGPVRWTSSPTASAAPAAAGTGTEA